MIKNNRNKMKSKKYLILPIIILVIVLLSGNFCFAQGTASAADTSLFASLMTIDWILIGFSLMLLLIIVILSNTLHLSMIAHEANEKEKKASSLSALKTLLIIVGLTAFITTDASAANSGLPEWLSGIRITMYILIIIELITILVIINWIKYFTGIEEYKRNQKILNKGKEWSFSKLWIALNKLRPIEEEGDLDTGHSYDGIRELDNATPPWFTYSFIASIIIAGIYMYTYHIAYSAPNQLEEYNIEVTEARLAQKAYLSGQGEMVDESNVTMLDASAIAIGKSIYAANCVACHGSDGQGGVGPNLTDDYWLHGGNIKDIFKTLKYGVVEKGMKAWKEDFSANQIAQLSSYIKSIHGTNPPGPKAQQGDLYDIKLDLLTSTDSLAKPSVN